MLHCCAQYNVKFVDQVAAMEARAAALGMPKTLVYLFPDNPYLDAGDLARAEALGLGANLVCGRSVGSRRQRRRFSYAFVVWGAGRREG